jgi:SAM-dependent MidA family methyltransferase
MAQALTSFEYLSIDLGRGALPDRFTGVVFSNEFFDALPVDRVVWEGGTARESLVGWRGERFVWTVGEPAGPEIVEYLDHYWPGEHTSAEVNLEALEWIDRIARSLDAGHVLTIDYGFRGAEASRYPDGTLMSYHRHAATGDVLSDPGERDITAHVCFSALEDRGAAAGLDTVSFEPLVRTLLDAGEADQFAEALERGGEAGRLQLKTLLVGMGENFRTLLQMKKAPTNRGLD